MFTYDRDPIPSLMAYMTWKKESTATIQIPDGRGYTFALCNLCSPSISQDIDRSCVGACASVMSQGQNLLAVLMPQFAYKKGQLYMASRAVEDIFIQCGLSMDSKWAIPFKQKSDARGSRPLMYDGRLVLPLKIKESEFVFKNTPSC